MRLVHIRRKEVVEFLEGNVPKYAILSHTWRAEEVSLQDMHNGHAFAKAGYVKIVQSCNQAEKDGLDYIWIDTCRIDKTNNVELSEAINSMFRWYREAEICYAFLDGVSSRAVDARSTLEQSFHDCRWFKRGWTLQDSLRLMKCCSSLETGSISARKRVYESYIQLGRAPTKVSTSRSDRMQMLERRSDRVCLECVDTYPPNCWNTERRVICKPAEQYRSYDPNWKPPQNCSAYWKVTLLCRNSKNDADTFIVVAGCISIKLCNWIGHKKTQRQITEKAAWCGLRKVNDWSLRAIWEDNKYYFWVKKPKVILSDGTIVFCEVGSDETDEGSLAIRFKIN